MTFFRYVGHVTTFSLKITTVCCLVVGLGLGLGYEKQKKIQAFITSNTTILLVSGYAHVLVLLSVVIVTLP